MSVKHIFLIAVMTSGFFFALTFDSWAGAYSKRDYQVGKIVMAALGASENTPPGENLMENMQYCGEKKKPDTYCFSETPVIIIDGKKTKYKWQSVIVFNRPYNNLSEISVPEKWRKAYIGKDSLGEGDIYYKVIKKKKTAEKATLVKFKQLVDGTQLGLTVKFYLPLNQARAVEIAQRRWQLLIAAAKKNGLLSQPQQPLELIALSGEMAGTSLVDGDVIQHVTNFSDPEDLSFSILGANNSKKQVLFIELPPSSQQQIDLSADKAEIVKTKTGYRITPLDRLVTLNMNLGKLKGKYPKLPGATSGGGYAAGPTEIVGRIKICNSPDDCDEVKVEIINWDIIVPRFYVHTRGEEKKRIHWKGTDDTPGKSKDFRFNQNIKNDWWYGYILKHEITSGQEDPILMGWALNNDENGVLRSAESSLAQNLSPIAPYLTKSPLVVQFDLEVIQGNILQVPTVSQRATQQYWNNQRKFWQYDYSVNYFALTVKRVETDSWEQAAAGKGQWDLRGNIDEETQERVVRMRKFGEDRISNFAPLKRLSINNRITDEINNLSPYTMGQFRFPGIYEVRLQMKIKRRNGPDSDCNSPEQKAVGQCKDVNIAIRIPVVNQSIEQKLIDYRTKRVSEQ